jgi:hypothetical protein
MHTQTQPGLHAHSWDRANDLMKRYVLERETPSGWLALKSSDAPAFLVPTYSPHTYRVYDQINNTVVLFH